MLLIGLALAGAGWGVLWSVNSYWNPLAFAGMWPGAAVVMWSLSRDGYPGVYRHLKLAAISVPLWWWFELVNSRTGNWEYLLEFDYRGADYAVLSSIAYATVVPAIMAAVALARSFVGEPSTGAVASRRFALTLVAVGLLAQTGVFALPAQFYPFVWVAPFLVFDGLAALMGRHSLCAALLRGRWRGPALLAFAGLGCGLLWEFWNSNASPMWIYHVPLLGFGKVFKMPVLGYLGYVPFAWSVVQLVALLDAGVARLRLSPTKTPSPDEEVAQGAVLSPPQRRPELVEGSKGGRM